jgi:hypothetical protein
MQTPLTRRGFVKGSLVGGAALALGAEARGQDIPKPPASASGSDARLPRGRIGKLEISRLILGGNLLTHYTHSRDLQYVYNLAAHYNTDAKILETLAVAESHGVNTLCMHNPPHPMSVLRRYRRERGGKIQWIICPTAPVEPGLAEYRKMVEELVKDGCEAIYLWGVHADALVQQGKLDLVAQAVEVPKEFGLPSGVGAHWLEVIEACEKQGVKADFYIKTFHHHRYTTGPKPDQLKEPYSEFPGYWCRDPEETAELMLHVKKPWIAFKTMAAGAIPPKSAFEYALANGADFVLAGMFDFEIAGDAQILRETLAGLTERKRAWQA